MFFGSKKDNVDKNFRSFYGKVEKWKRKGDNERENEMYATTDIKRKIYLTKLNH